MFTKLVFHCNRSLSGKIFNIDISHKNGVTIEELLLNNYSFKRSGFFVKSVFVQERNTPGGIDVSLYIKHDDCSIDFLVSFSKSIILRCDIGSVTLKTCHENEFYFGNVTDKSALLSRMRGSIVISIFCEYFSFLMVGHGFPEKILLDQDVRAQNVKCNSLMNQVVDRKISIYQLSLVNVASFNLIIRHENEGSGFGVSAAEVFSRQSSELADRDKMSSSIDYIWPLFMSVAMSFLCDWVDNCNDKSLVSTIAI